MRIAVVVGLLAGLLLRSADSEACGWDRDTLAMERREFPGIVELITGKFLFHSDELYRWRIADRERRLLTEPENVALYDDLGVALDKIGQHKRAVEVMERKHKIRPGLYETHANWGTFLIHDGQLEAGLVHIKKAIEINPDAHFGREIIQQRLVEYILELKSNNGGKLELPLRCMSMDCSIAAAESLAIDGLLRGEERAQMKAGEVATIEPHFLGRKEFGFAAFLAARGHNRDEAIKGVTGMMKFGNYRSPILLEALGDVLMWPAGPDHPMTPIATPGRRIAARAYLAAAALQSEPEPARLYRAFALSAFLMQSGAGWFELHRRFNRELRRGARFSKRVHDNERRWIKKGVNPDVRFERRYYRKDAR